MRTYTFERGKHYSRDNGMCLMETVAFLAGEEHTDSPKCSDFSITRVARKINDACSDVLRQELLQDLPLRIIGTANPKFAELREKMLEQIYTYFGPNTGWYNCETAGIIEITNFKNSTKLTIYGKEVENFLRWAKARLDEMISLTEIRETPDGVIEPVVTGEAV